MEEKNNGIKITSAYPERMVNVCKKGWACVKKGVIVLVIAGMLFTLSGCGGPSISERNDSSTYTVSQGETHYSSRYTAFSDEDIANLPSSIESLTFDYCHYLSDLSELPSVCPNLKRLTLNNCASIDSLDFLFDFEHLEYVKINDCAFLDRALVADLEGVGIEVDVTESDLDAADKVNEILGEIITEDMTDEEKIQAITFYVIDNYSYKITKVFESNEEPLESMLDNKGGVCASYAYLTNVLLRKAGIESYEITSDSHGWNVIELDGKYYYLDATNIKQVPWLSKYFVKWFNVGFCYMTDPRANSFSAMKDFDDTSKVVIPQSLIEDIEAGQSEKNIWEKYGNSIPARIIEIILIIAAISGGFTLAGKAVDNIKYGRRRRRRRRR